MTLQHRGKHRGISQIYRYTSSQLASELEIEFGEFWLLVEIEMRRG